MGDEGGWKLCEGELGSKQQEGQTTCIQLLTVAVLFHRLVISSGGFLLQTTTTCDWPGKDSTLYSNQDTRGTESIMELGQGECADLQWWRSCLRQIH